MHYIISKLVGLHQGSINESHVTEEILDPTCEGNPLLDNQPLDLICNSLINAWQNEYHIITNRSLGPIPHECVMYVHIVMLEILYEIRKALF